MIEEHLRRERRSCIKDVLVCLLWLATLLFFIYPYLLSRIEIYFSKLMLDKPARPGVKYIKIKFETNKIKKGIKV